MFIVTEQYKVWYISVDFIVIVISISPQAAVQYGIVDIYLYPV